MMMIRILLPLNALRSAPLGVVALNLFSFFLSLSLSFNWLKFLSFSSLSRAFLCVYFFLSSQEKIYRKRKETIF